MLSVSLTPCKYKAFEAHSNVLIPFSYANLICLMLSSSSSTQSCHSDVPYATRQLASCAGERVLAVMLLTYTCSRYYISIDTSYEIEEKDELTGSDARL